MDIHAPTTIKQFAAIAACSFIAASPPLLAQEQTPIEEITVRATRIEKPLNRVPAALSVIDQDVIQLGRQQLALDESLNRVPGVFMQNRYNFAQDLRVSIRGFGARANFGIRGIKILVDGIPETLPDGQGSVDSIDIGATSRIEVLRGPSSSIWGNASGGVISVTSERAPEERFAEFRVTAGEFDFQKLQFKTGQQGDRVGYLLSLSDSSYDGYRAQNRAENTQLSSRITVDLGGDRELATVISYTDQPVSDDPGGINAAQAALDPTSARDANINFNGGESLEQTRVGFVYNMPLGEGGSLSARNYYAWRDFANRLPFTGGGIVNFDRFFVGGGINYTHAGTWAGRPNTFIIGLDIDQQDDDRFRFDNLAGVQGPLTFDQNETVRSRGLFAQNDLELTDTISLSFGVRFDEVEFDVTDRFLSNGDDSGTVSLDDVSPMVGISVELSDTLNVYGTYSSAFETPTTTEFNQPDGSGGFNASLKPQVARNLEVGLRGLLGERARYEIAVFNITVDDELIPFEVATSPGRDFFANAGESNRNGVEFSLTANPTDRVSAIVSYTYSDFEFDRFVDDNGNNFAGNTIPGTAENVLFGELTYSHPRGWFASIDALRISDQFTNNANTAINDSYVLSNLRVGFEHETETLKMSPFLGINNIFDETYNANVRINAFGGRFFEPGPDRNIYAGITVRFKRL